jgi:hypothetical protein
MCPRLRTCAGGVRGRWRTFTDVCYGILRAAAFVYESDHNALVYARQGQVVLEEGGEEEPEWSTLIAGNPPPIGGFPKPAFTDVRIHAT